MPAAAQSKADVDGRGPKKVCLYWAVRDRAQAGWFTAKLDAAVERAPAGTFEAQVYVTRGADGEVAPLSDGAARAQFAEGLWRGGWKISHTKEWSGGDDFWGGLGAVRRRHRVKVSAPCGQERGVGRRKKVLKKREEGAYGVENA